MASDVDPLRFGEFYLFAAIFARGLLSSASGRTSIEQYSSGLIDEYLWHFCNAYLFSWRMGRRQSNTKSNIISKISNSGIISANRNGIWNDATITSLTNSGTIRTINQDFAIKKCQRNYWHFNQFGLHNQKGC